MARCFPLGLIVLSLFFILFAPNTASAQDQDYRFGPRDVIRVSVYAGGEEQVSADLTVSASGRITVPMLGMVAAGGMTVGELEKNLHETFGRDFFVDPQVTVAIKEYHSLAYYISGSVARPGLYELTRAPTILELIAKAGGLVAHHGQTAYILRDQHDRETNRPIVLELQPLLYKGDMTSNLRLQTGDVIHIPLETEVDQASNSIYVEGEVVKPGVYAFQPGITALGACIQAGGFNKYAAPNRARIIRKGDNGRQVIEINLDEVKKGKARDIELIAGDLIHVPETWL